jgi:hypothetical protein
MPAGISIEVERTGWLLPPQITWSDDNHVIDNNPPAFLLLGNGRGHTFEQLHQLTNHVVSYSISKA